jgi:VanZ family protein
MSPKPRPSPSDQRPRTEPRFAWVHWTTFNLIAVLGGILYTSLARRGVWDCRDFASHLVRESLSIQWSDGLGNFLAYALLGAAMTLAWLRHAPNRRSGMRIVVTIVALGSALSLGVEAIQACLTERFSSAIDWLLNSAGTAAGAVLITCWRHPGVPPLPSAPALPTLRRRLIGLATGAWIISDTAPWRIHPSWDLAAEQLLGIGQALIHAQLDPWRMAGHLGEWLALGLGYACVRPRSHSAGLRILSIAAGVMAVRLWMPEVLSTPPEQIMTLLIAAPMLMLLPRAPAIPLAVGALSAALVAALAWQLEPGYGAPQAMRWRVLLLHGDAVTGIQEAAWYGWWALTLMVTGTVWRTEPKGWIALPPLCLALFTALQTQIPGRTPDLSGVLLTTLYAVMGARILAGSRRPTVV